MDTSTKKHDHHRTQLEQGYCLCKNKLCGFTQKNLSGYNKGPIPSRHKGSAAKWCKPLAKPIKVHFDPDKSNYQSWLLILSICHHIPAFLTEFRHHFIVNSSPLSGGEKKPRKQWLINRIHFPGALLVHREEKKCKLSFNTSVMSPAVAKFLDGIDNAHDGLGYKKRMTDRENTVGFLETYARGILSANLFQVFMNSKGRVKTKNLPSPDYLVQAPVISIEDVCRFCLALKIQIPTRALNTRAAADHVPMRQLVMAPPPPPDTSSFTQCNQLPPPPRKLATIKQKGVMGEVILASDDGSLDLPRTGISIPMTHKGNLTIYPRMVEAEEAIQLTNHLVADPGIFRQNKCCGFSDEPRVQAHFHSEATEEFDKPQPGYKYGVITLKGRPLHTVPCLAQLAERCGRLCNVVGDCCWNIGTTVVYYRNGKDYMGQHKGKLVSH
jgi:hypothetical protein